MAKRKKSKWYHPKVHTDWKKGQSESTRRSKIKKAVCTLTKWKNNKHECFLASARKIGALCNVNQGPEGDPETRRKACADAKYFYKMQRKYPKKP